MSFREDVYAAVRKIKPGHVATYGEIALMIRRPGSARALLNQIFQKKKSLLRLCHCRR